MAIRTVLSKADELIPEGTTPTLSADIVDENGALITGLLTLKATLYNVKTGAIINDIDNANFLSKVVDGHFSWTLTPDDTVIVIDVKEAKELHRLLLEWTWGALSEKSGAHEIDHYVVNLEKVPHVTES